MVVSRVRSYRVHRFFRSQDTRRLNRKNLEKVDETILTRPRFSLLVFSSQTLMILKSTSINQYREIVVGCDLELVDCVDSEVCFRMDMSFFSKNTLVYSSEQTKCSQTPRSTLEY